MKKVLTLCLVSRNNHILLGMKKRGFGEGRWNGFGGKLQDGETIEDALFREMKEEAGVDLIDPQKRGVLNFTFEGNPEVLEVHVFSAEDIDGELTETEEMKPQWFLEDEIPYDEMWPDDKLWLPLLLAGENFEGDFYFKDSDTLVRHDLRIA